MLKAKTTYHTRPSEAAGKLANHFALPMSGVEDGNRSWQADCGDQAPKSPRESRKRPRSPSHSLTHSLAHPSCSAGLSYLPTQPQGDLQNGLCKMERCSYAGSYPGPTSRRVHLVDAFRTSSRASLLVRTAHAQRASTWPPQHFTVRTPAWSCRAFVGGARLSLVGLSTPVRSSPLARCEPVTAAEMLAQLQAQAAQETGRMRLACDPRQRRRAC